MSIKSLNTKVEIGKGRLLQYIVLTFIIISLVFFSIYIFNKYSSLGNPTLQHDIEGKFSNLVLSSKNKNLFLTDISTGKTKSLEITGELDSRYDLYSYNAAFSPDKKQFIFIKEFNLWKVDTDDKNPTQLTTQGREQTKTSWGVSIGEPRWSPNGKFLYYQVGFSPQGEDPFFFNPKTAPPLPDIKPGVWLTTTTPDSSNIHKHLVGPDAGVPVGWTPDSKKIIFVPNDPYYSTYTYDIETGVKSSLFHDIRILRIFWSRDGKRGVFTHGKTDESYIIDNNFNVIKIVQRQRPNQVTNDFWESHVLSPDGKYALITKTTTTEGPDDYEYQHKVKVFLFDIKTQKQTELPIYFSLSTKPFWTQDGKKLVYIKQIPLQGSTSVSGEKGDLFIYDFDTKKEKRITNSQDFDPFNIDF